MEEQIYCVLNKIQILILHVLTPSHLDFFLLGKNFFFSDFGCCDRLDIKVKVSFHIVITVENTIHFNTHTYTVYKI